MRACSKKVQEWLTGPAGSFRPAREVDMAEKGSSLKARDAGGAARLAGQTAAHESAGGVGVRGPVVAGLGIIALFFGGFLGWAARGKKNSERMVCR